MAQIQTLELESKAAQVREVLAEAVHRYGRVVYANSLGAEAMVLTDIICSSVPQIDIVSIDTGRLHEETYDLLAKLQRRLQQQDPGHLSGWPGCVGAGDTSGHQRLLRQHRSARRLLQRAQDRALPQVRGRL